MLLLSWAVVTTHELAPAPQFPSFFVHITIEYCSACWKVQTLVQPLKRIVIQREREKAAKFVLP